MNLTMRQLFKSTHEFVLRFLLDNNPPEEAENLAMAMRIKGTLLLLLLVLFGQRTLAQTTRSTPTFEDGVYKIGTLLNCFG